MHTPTIFLAGVAALSAFASAAEEARRPRFYFPREVKRQIFTNSSSTAESTLVETTPSTLSTSTTKRFSLPDIFDTLTGTSDVNTPTLSSPADTIVSTTTLTTVEPFPRPTTPTSQSTGGVPSTILLPTSTPEEPTESNTPSTSTSSTSGGIIVPGPGGTLTSSAESTTSLSSSAAPPPSSEEEISTSTSRGVTFTGPGASTAPGSTEQTSATSAPGSSTTEVSSTAVTSAEPTSLTSAQPTTEATTEATTQAPSATSTPSSTPATSEPASSQTTVVPSSSSGILDITSLLEPITSALSSFLSSTTIADGTGSSTVVVPTSTASSETTPTPSTPLESVISSILSSIVPTDIPPTSTEPTTTEPPTSVTPVVTPTGTLEPPPVTNGTDTTVTPPTATPSDSTPTVTTPGETITPTTTAVVTPTETTVPPVTTDVPSGNQTEPVTTPTLPPVITPTPLPGGNETTVDPSVTTTAPSGTGTLTTEPVITPTDSGTVVPTGNVTDTATPIATPQPTAAPNGTEPAASATPLTTLPGTTLDWGTSLIVAPTMTTQEPGATASTEPTGIPTTLPKVVGNPNERVDKSAPPGMTEVQLGFLYPLNFRFVVANAMSSAQIFAYLPEGLADGLNVTRDQVTIKNLAPLDTTAQLGFITTMARAYIPESSFRKLQASIHLPNTPMYANDDQRVETLMNYINPAIPLQPGGSLGGPADSGPGSPGDEDNKGKNEDPFNGQQATSSGKVNGTTAGFVVAGVGGAVAYGAAMFLIARRYKKRRQSHRRSQSLTNPSEMMQSGSPSYMGGAGAFMSGGRMSPGGTNDRNSRGSGRTGNSARTAQISAPMMAENSLGWN